MKLALREYRFPDGQEYIRNKKIGYDQFPPNNNESISCEYGGDADTDFSDFNDLIVDSGDTIRYEFNDCLFDSFFGPINGSITINIVNASDGFSPDDIYSSNFTLAYNLYYHSYTFEDDELEGAKEISIINEYNTKTTTTTLQHFFEDGWDHYTWLKDFEIVSTESPGQSFGLNFSLTISGDFNEQDLGGYLNLETIDALMFPDHTELAYPNSGLLEVESVDNTSITIEPADTGVTVVYYEDGEAMLNTFLTWTELQNAIDKELFPQTKTQ